VADQPPRIASLASVIAANRSAGRRRSRFRSRNIADAKKLDAGGVS